MTEKRINELKVSLLNDKNPQFETSLTEIKKSDNAVFIEHLVERLSTEDPNSDVFSLIYDTLSQIKLSAAMGIFAQWLERKKAAHIHQNLLFFIWNSGLDAGDHLHTVTRAGLQGDFMTTLEALTVLENQEGPFEEEIIMEALLACKEHLSNATVPDDKRNLTDSIVVVLNQLEGGIQDA